MIHCPQTMNNLANLRCRSRSGVYENLQFQKFMASVIRPAYLSLNIWTIPRISAAKAMSKISNLMCPIPPRKPNYATALETGNAVMGTPRTILPISVHYGNFVIWLHHSKSKLCWHLIKFANIGLIMPLVSWGSSKHLLETPKYVIFHIFKNRWSGYIPNSRNSKNCQCWFYSLLKNLNKLLYRNVLNKTKKELTLWLIC